MRWPMMIRAKVGLATLAVSLGVTFATCVHADDPQLTLASRLPQVCRDQTYALCTGAKCVVFNGVAYCGCEVKHGDSLSKQLSVDGADVCQINGAGPANGYMVSTFSEPTSIVAPLGDQALYNCPRTANGSYGTCDGGICFTSTEGKFPGQPPSKNQIVCSCPITTPDPLTAKAGHQIIGPYPCQSSFFQYCGAAVSNTKTGSTIYAAAATGAVRLNIFLLTGMIPPVHVCRPPP